MSNIRAVLFDVDGVLLDSGAANIAFYQELYRQGGLAVPSAEALGAENHRSMVDNTRKFFPELTDQEIGKLVTLADQIEAGFSLLRPMPGVAEIIPELSLKYKLGLVTNRVRSGVEELWQVIGLQKHFSAVAAYEDTPKHKPDAEPVRFALSQLGVKPEEAVFIGDAVTDLQAARAAEVRFILYGQAPVPPGTPILKDFLGLPDLLESLS